MFTGNIWRFLILETFVMGVLCCWCPYYHPQYQFCKSKFVLKVDIHSDMSSLDYNPFIIDIKEIFKGNVGELMVLRPKFYILVTSKECPTDAIKIGNTYLIFGFNLFQKYVIETMPCYGIMPWENTTVFYRHALAELYEGNCDCVPGKKDTMMRRHCKSNSFM